MIEKRSKKRSNSFTIVSDILKRKIVTNSSQFDVRNFLIEGIWDKVVGPKIVKHTQPLNVSKNSKGVLEPFVFIRERK